MSTTPDATMAEQLREWADSLDRVGATDEMLLRGIIAGMREVSNDLEPKTRIRRRIVITRYWFEDKKFVMRQRPSNPIKGWLQQVKDEFNWPGVNHPDGDGVSVVDLDNCVSVTQHEDGNATLKVNAWLDFVYAKSDLEDAGFNGYDDPDVCAIQHLFYDEGGVAGEFHMLDDGGEK